MFNEVRTANRGREFLPLFDFDEIILKRCLLVLILKSPFVELMSLFDWT